MRGIDAGSGLATSEMRLVMVDIVDAALMVHPYVEPTLFVDDLSVEVDGDDDFIVTHCGGFTKIVVERIKADGMEVSETKSVVSASHSTLGSKLADKLAVYNIKHTRRVKSLGVGLGPARNETPWS